MITNIARVGSFGPHCSLPSWRTRAAPVASSWCLVPLTSSHDLDSLNWHISKVLTKIQLELKFHSPRFKY